MQFELYSQYYDLIYDSKDYSAETKKVFQKLDLKKPKLLELGCGSGGHASYLANLGCSIIGLDLSESMVQIANSKNIQNFNAIKANIEDFNLGEKFDAAISMFHVMSYLSTNESVINCFTSVSAHLNPGGAFIFDFWFAPAVYHQGFEHRLKKFSNDRIKVIRTSSSELDIPTNTANVTFEIQVSGNNTGQTETIIEEHRMRFFSIPEIQLFASQTGFEVIEFFDLHSEKPPTLDTWAITVKLLKK